MNTNRNPEEVLLARQEVLNLQERMAGIHKRLNTIAKTYTFGMQQLNERMDKLEQNG